MNWFKLFRLRRHGLRGHLNLMAKHLIQCADTIQELRLENEALRARGERLAAAIELNDWTVEAAERMHNTVAMWREFSK